MSNINSPKKNSGDGGCLLPFLIAGLFLLIYSFWPKDQLIYYFILIGAFFIALFVYLNRLFRSETKKIESETFEKAKLELETAKDVTEKAILSKYVDSKRLEREKRVLEPIVGKLSIKAKRTNNKEIQEQYLSKKAQLDDIETQLSSAYYDADEEMSEEQIAAFKKVLEAYDLLKKSRMIWEVLSKYKYSESEKNPQQHTESTVVRSILAAVVAAVHFWEYILNLKYRKCRILPVIITTYIQDSS